MAVLRSTVRGALPLDSTAPDDYSTAGCIGLSARMYKGTPQDHFPTSDQGGVALCEGMRRQ